MNKVFLVDNKHICEVPLAMREELTNKGVIPKEIDPENTELVVSGVGSWCVVWYNGKTKYTYMPLTGTVVKE